jgi:D-galacturonate reductase
MTKGDMAIIVTPDDTHFDIAKYAIEHGLFVSLLFVCLFLYLSFDFLWFLKGLHCMVTKPAVKTLREQLELMKYAEQNTVIVAVEFHKRFDPMYSDAREKIRLVLFLLSFFIYFFLNS